MVLTIDQAQQILNSNVMASVRVNEIAGQVQTQALPSMGLGDLLTVAGTTPSRVGNGASR